MGYVPVEALSSPFSPQDVQGSIPAWLSTQLRYDQAFQLPNPLTCKQDVDRDNDSDTWVAGSRRCTQDIDQSSIASVDDDISVSDSAHGSSSSEASSQTSWTCSIESSDTFIDEEVKDLQQLTKVNSYSAAEAQEQALSGIQTDDYPAAGVNCRPCPIESAIHSVKGGVSKLLGQTCPERPQKPSEGCPRTWVADLPGVQTTRSRRSGCSSIRSCPPKLKRDTDVTEQFVALLIIFAKRLITAIWPSSDCPPMSSDCFGAGVLPLETFIRETLRRSKTSFSTLQVALYYLILLKSTMPQGHVAPRCKNETPEKAQCRAMQCGRRMFLSALMLASKYLQDRNYSARAWSKISGLRSNEINENEREYLAKINYDLHMPKEMFENWSKVVLVLSKLSNERPCFQPASFDTSFGPFGPSSDTSLAGMVAQGDLHEGLEHDSRLFTGAWWSMILQKLDPSIVKDASLADQFLHTHLPRNKLQVDASLPQMGNIGHSSSGESRPSLSSITHCEDLNFGDMSNARGAPMSSPNGMQTPQSPLQMSPANRPTLPSRPQLANLPTPQTTPRLSYDATGENSCMRTPLRFAASMEAMRNLRKQCFKNANLERCPPPRPQTVVLPSMKSLIRSAESNQDFTMRATTPLTSSPASVASDSTTLTSSTSRSRSSSISSISSWSSLGPTNPHLRRSAACGLSSPLSRVCSLADGTYQNISNNYRTSVGTHSDDAGSVSSRSQTPMSTPGDESLAQIEGLRSSSCTPNSSEVAAIRGLMSLSTQSETPSQSVTPTPQRLSELGITAISKNTQHSKEHKRKLSKTEPNLQAQVRDLVWDGSWAPSNKLVEDPLLPYFGAACRRTQMSTSLRKENRRPLSTPSNNKRLCSLQMHFQSRNDETAVH